MMLKRYTGLIPAITILLLVGSASLAQPPVKPLTTPFAKFKPPVVRSMLGNLTGKTAVTNAEAGKQLIALPLKIMDDKNNNYNIASYQFAYKRMGVTEDEETGKIIPQSDVVAERFTATPLPALWQNIITESLHKGEELYFFDIITIDKQGRRFFAPELKIIIQ